MRLHVTLKTVWRYLAKNLFCNKRISLRIFKRLTTLLYSLEKISSIQETQNIQWFTIHTTNYFILFAGILKVTTSLAQSLSQKITKKKFNFNWGKDLLLTLHPLKKFHKLQDFIYQNLVFCKLGMKRISALMIMFGGMDKKLKNLMSKILQPTLMKEKEYQIKRLK